MVNKVWSSIKFFLCDRIDYLDHFTSRLNTKNYFQKQNIQIKCMLLHQDNDVKEQISHVHVSLKQPFKNTHLQVQTAKKKWKVIRMQQRDNIKREGFFVAADESIIR